MAKNLTQKILDKHIISGDAQPGGEVGIRIDQTLTQDATGTTAYLLLEAMDIPRVRTELSVSYVDHNMIQIGPENANDHLYLQTVAAAKGVYFSRPGNGICHQVHLERFARPGRTLLGSDSHTPTAGGMGMLAIGAGGLDVAVAMGGGAFYLTWPKVIGVELRGRLQPWVSPKDIALRLLSILSTRGNVGCVVEYFGPGVKYLPVPARATCANMGAELGVTCSVFPSDDLTKQFLAAQGRGDQYEALAADEGAVYDRMTKTLHAQKDAAIIENIKKHCKTLKISSVDGDGFVKASFGKIVASMVSDIIMPPIGRLLGKVDFSSLFINMSGKVYNSLAEAQAAGAPTLNYGIFINNVINFLIVAFVIFILIRQINKLQKPAKAGSPAAPTTKECPFCCSTIAIKAVRCPNCTSQF